MISASTALPYLLNRTTRSGFLNRKGRLEMCSLLEMSVGTLVCLLVKRKSDEFSGVGKLNLSVCDCKLVNGEMGGVAILKLQSRKSFSCSLDLRALLWSAGSLQIAIVNHSENR